MVVFYRKKWFGGQSTPVRADVRGQERRTDMPLKGYTCAYEIPYCNQRVLVARFRLERMDTPRPQHCLLAIDHFNQNIANLL